MRAYGELTLSTPFWGVVSCNKRNLLLEVLMGQEEVYIAVLTIATVAQRQRQIQTNLRNPRQDKARKEETR